MGTENKSLAHRDSNLWYHVGKSLVNQYWPFSLVPPAVMTMGMAVATVSTGAAWDWRLWGTTVAFLWIVDQGMKTVDLAAPDINVDVDSGIQFRVGAVMIGVGIAIGVLLAWETSWWFLAILALGVFLALAYNLEWFGGLFHDRDYLAGRMNLGFCVVTLPTVTGYFLLTHSVSPGIVLISASPALNMSSMVLATGDYKHSLYTALGIEYERDVTSDVKRLKKRLLQGQMYRLAGLVLTPVGFYLELVHGFGV